MVIIIHNEGPYVMQLHEFAGMLDRFDYPTTTDDICAAYGGTELSFQNGAETVSTALNRCGPQSFDGPDEARLTLYSAVCEDAIGRKGYADRDPPLLGEVEHVSF